jgi:hypothetical protein
VTYQLRSLLSAARAALSDLEEGDTSFPTDELPLAGFFDNIFE